MDRQMSKEKIYDLEFAERMQFILTSKFNGNSSEFARNIGVAVTSLKRWLTGEADPSRSNLIKIATVGDVDLKWLATGNGNSLSSPVRTELKKEVVNLLGSYDVEWVNCYRSVNVSAGFGSFNDGVTKADGKMPYAATLFNRLGISGHNCAVFWARGNSMSPTIADNDQLLVDLTQRAIVGDNVYLVQNGESVWVKRIKVAWNGIELISDNKDEYPPINIPAVETEYLQIIGRVVYVGHSLI